MPARPQHDTAADIDVVGRLAAEIAGAPPAPPSALARAADALTDTLACILASKDEPVVRALFDGGAIVAHEIGECVVPGFGRADAVDAALCNATAAHAQDFDDYHGPSIAHAGAPLVAVCLALGECENAGGARVLDAHVHGLQAMRALGDLLCSEHYTHGWHATSTIGALGAAAAGARLFRLDATRAAAAMSLASSIAGGFLSQIGTLAKPLHDGFAAQLRPRAALLARAGITASPRAVQGPRGALQLWMPTGAAARADVAADGYSIETDGLFVKRYPCCGYILRPVDAALDIAARDGFRAGEVRAAKLSAPARHLKVVEYENPQNSLQARFSYHFCVAAALAHGELTNEHFSPRNLQDPAVRELMAKICVEGYPVAPETPDNAAEIPDILKVEMHDGAVFECSVGEPLGAPSRPLTRDALLAKLWDNNRHRALAARRAQIDAALQNAAELESIKDLTELLCATAD
ncbi:MAG: MmgE/PrpD family protein [Gammaproteobacteria bacterium]|nr:MmgE/PrpD family protein [Gammaproteobacteria bacterium]